MNARENLYAGVMSGGSHSPDRSNDASYRIDAFRDEVRLERDDEIVKWLLEASENCYEELPVISDVLAAVARKINLGTV